MIPRKSQVEVVFFVFLTTELLKRCLAVSLILATLRQRGLTAGRRKCPEPQQKEVKRVHGVFEQQDGNKSPEFLFSRL